MQVSVNVVTAEARATIRRLKRECPAALAGAKRRAFARIKQKAVAEAKANCPVSPTKAQYEANLTRGALAVGAFTRLTFSKGGRAQAGASKLRSRRTDFTPGSLTKSIEGRSTGELAEVFVPANSLGGRYAHFIEDEGPRGGGKWRKRGIGTERKGARAGDKFMRRAVEENEDAFRAMLEGELRRALEGLNRR